MRPTLDALSALAVIAALAGCGRDVAPTPTDATAIATAQDTTAGKGSLLARTFAFVCGEGPVGDTRFVVRIEGTRAFVYPGEQQTPLRLDRLDGDTTSVDLGTYADGGDRLVMMGDSARLTAAAKRYEGCHNRPDEALWEYARLNGVDFRAVGHGPAWNLDVHDDSLLVFVTDSGRTRLVFPAPPPDVNARALRGVYRASAGARTIEATLRGQACIDADDGTRFETTVAVRLDSATYVGCGRNVR